MHAEAEVLNTKKMTHFNAIMRSDFDTQLETEEDNTSDDSWDVTSSDAFSDSEYHEPQEDIWGSEFDIRAGIHTCPGDIYVNMLIREKQLEVYRTSLGQPALPRYGEENLCETRNIILKIFVEKFDVSEEFAHINTRPIMGFLQFRPQQVCDRLLQKQLYIDIPKSLNSISQPAWCMKLTMCVILIWTTIEYMWGDRNNGLVIAAASVLFFLRTIAYWWDRLSWIRRGFCFLKSNDRKLVLEALGLISWAVVLIYGFS